MKKICRPCAILTLAMIQACGWSGSDVDRPGRLVIVGGALQSDNEAVYRAVIDGREGDGPLCVVPTASSDPQEAMEGAVEDLGRYGGPGSAAGVLISTDEPARAHDASVVAQLEACSGFYFTGGSQSRILDVFLPAGDTSDAYRTLWRRWQDGAVVAGTSAGAAMMSRMMISGGGSDEALTHGVTASTEEDGVWIRPGMGFFEPILDQHFLARGRIGRLLVSVIQPDLPRVGLGIDENTALVVDGDSAEVVGASGVVVVDGHGAQQVAPNCASGIRVSLAGSGDIIDLETLDVTPASSKTPAAVTEPSVGLPDDPFARWAFLHLIADLAASEAGEAVFRLPTATLRISEDVEFSAFVAGEGGGVEGSPIGLSAGPFRVELLDPGTGH